ncbi:MAG: endonuclease domain-containing protein [Anaerolineales bacterium]|nr:endonuclease domain-containing protein [Anaerolineales bacterium]
MPPRRTTPQGYAKARQLRKALTPAERKLWAVLRGDKLGVNFRRQHAIGPYIADFCCVKKKLIIELDGGQHLKQREYDEERTRVLKSLGYRVIRFWNDEVMKDIEGVIHAIRLALAEPEVGAPSAMSPAGGRRTTASSCPTRNAARWWA